jgi:hypothetical protein
MEMVLYREDYDDLLQVEGTKMFYYRQVAQEQVTASKETLGIHDPPSGGNLAHLTYIKEKVGEWVSRMTNGHLPSHMAWVAYRYRHQLWLGLDMD